MLLEGKKNKEKKKMYCRKCGARMSEQDRFCPECGTEASKGNTQQDELNGFPGNEQPQENPRMNKKTVIWIWILAAWILLIAIGISAFFIVKGQHVKKQYQSSLEAGDKYLENLDYEKAEDAYLQAIKISPKEKESYEKLIQYYVDHNEIDKAKKIVKKAKKNLPKSESKKIEEKQKEWEKLEKNLGGIKEMKKIPDAIFIVDPKKERICVQEAHALGITLIGIADTNCDPDELDYVIPGNDDAIRAVNLIVSKMADAVIEANQGEEVVAADAEEVAEEA